MYYSTLKTLDIKLCVFMRSVVAINLDLHGIRQISEFKDVEVAVKMLRLQ